jgi:hypothetical protein
VIIKKPIGQLIPGDKVFVRVGGSKFKSACEVREITFNNVGEENETATILFDDGTEQWLQNWYVIETIGVI